MTFGRSISIADYLAETATTDAPRSVGADDYVAPYLRQACRQHELDPISRWPRYWTCWARLQSASTLATEAVLVLGDQLPRSSLRGLLDRIQLHLTQLACATDGSVPASSLEAVGPLEHEAAVAMSEACGGRSLVTSDDPPAGWLVLNPWSNVQRRLISDVALGSASAAVYAWGPAAGAAGRSDVIVDVPANGFVWQSATPVDLSTSPQQPNLIHEQEDYIALRNEFFDAQIDRATGGLRALYDYVARGNRLSQRLVSRSSNGASTEMVADRVWTVAAGGIRGEVRSTGRLIGPEGVAVGEFEMAYTIQRGSRLLSVTVRLDALRPIVGDPWQDYVGLRSAWSNEASQLVRCVNELPHATDARYFESPLFVEIDDVQRRTAILGGGLAYYRRAERRRLDTLLCVSGESARTFQLYLGVDLPDTLSSALGQLAAPAPVPLRQPPANDTGWLFHRDARRVQALDWLPVWDGERPVGFRVSLLETAGRQVTVTIRVFRAVREARIIDAIGHEMAKCEVIDGTIRLSLAANEWTQVEARW